MLGSRENTGGDMAEGIKTLVAPRKQRLLTRPRWFARILREESA